MHSNPLGPQFEAATSTTEGTTGFVSDDEMHRWVWGKDAAMQYDIPPPEKPSAKEFVDTLIKVLYACHAVLPITIDPPPQNDIGLTAPETLTAELGRALDAATSLKQRIRLLAIHLGGAVV